MLEEFGYNERINQFIMAENSGNVEAGRVIREEKERYLVQTKSGEVEAEITGNLRFSATGREDLPAVGDWVLLSIYDPGCAVIHKIIPRLNMLSRQAVGHPSEKQIIAANIDFALLVQAVDRDFNLNRLERYLTICFSSGVNPVIVLTKTDLTDDQTLEGIIQSVRKRGNNIPVYAISNETGKGFDLFQKIFGKGKTYCLLGSSGVGKSTLINTLSGKQLMKTGAISDSTNKGKHVTSHRELVLLKEGGVLIDNPGMREVGIADSGVGLEYTFDLIRKLSASCRFNDCTHTNEAGCAVTEALENGELAREIYLNYLKLQKEKDHFETSLSEKRKKDKVFGKILKEYQKRDFKGRN
jgi:ribosome biogenesis GTPase / thiamine phosphate phosphatase